MKTSSSKAKGHKLEYLVRDKLIEKFNLTSEDIRATIGTETGSDIKLNSKSKRLIPLQIECKARSSMVIYTYYEQASKQKDGLEPCVIVKANRKKPLACIDLDYFLELLMHKNINFIEQK